MGLACKIHIFKKLAASHLSWTLKQPQLVSQNSRQLFLIYSKFFFKWWEEKWVIQAVVSTCSTMSPIQWDQQAAFCIKQKTPAIPLLLCTSSLCCEEDGAFCYWQLLGEIVCCFVWDSRQYNHRRDPKAQIPCPWLLKLDHCD